ncbi:DUF397 domain-containing protein [Actinomadura madurae]|uniref:DUF397 domain-containing protein n=1 Tax=Actinomadura madurae TaxID=1993 RepID=A0A1I5YC66_9ACTN|nr:DUF397 domain-containing protein [Actinomadura madurae]URN07948.1 DUF397 domain-containing protein [Actinomadura madurae]SFQ41720.1 protein of unknown function [Actinomadura madurae]
MDLKNIRWRRSSYTGSNGGNCVELADATGTTARAVAVRDSKDPDGPILLLTRAALRTSIQSITATH